MNWFGRKKKEENEQLKQLQKNVTSISAQLEDISESVAKLTRVQFKSMKNMEEKISDVETSLASQEEQKAVIAQNSQFKAEQGIISRQLMEQLDEIDHVLSGISEHEQQWRDLLLNWSRDTKRNLETLGVYEIHVSGTTFNPRTAESVKTVEKTDFGTVQKLPYEVVEVYKRGFATKDGQLIRKAIVATVKEDSFNGNR